MGAARTMAGPTLVFLDGPQAGLRTEIAASPATLGRNPTCEVQTVEQTISREQARFELTVDGWVVQCLSSMPLRINAKRYKPGKAVLLDTGDVLSVGAETEILYVAPGDDVEAAVSRHRGELPLAPTPAAVEAPSDDVEIVTDEPPVPPTDVVAPPTAAPRAKPKPDDESQADPEAARKKAKLRKYAIGFVIYLGVMAALFGALAFLKPGKDTNGPVTRELVKLSEDDIRQAVEAPLDVPMRPTEAARTLRRALEFYERELDRPGDLYRAVKYFKLHLAFQGSPQFEDPRHGRVFLDAQDRLVERVQRRYAEAWAHENARNWRDALARYETLLRMLPVMVEPHAEDENVIFQNVMEHISYVRSRMKSKRR